MDGLRKDAARNRARIVEIARGVVRRGEPLALNAVARAADVGVGTVYRHFATVEELEETLVWDRFDELEDMMRAAGHEQLERVLTAHFALLTGDALFEKVTARQQLALPATAQRRDALIHQLTRIMADARAQGRLRTEVDAPGVLLLMCGLAHAARSSGAGADGPEARVLLRVGFDGLRTA
jgi:AcrR family transcriptional regulator